MPSFFRHVKDIAAGFVSWFGSSVKQTTASYCDLQTADGPSTLVGNDGALVSILEIAGVTALIGQEEFESIQLALHQSLQTTMAQPGHTIQVLFSYDKDQVATQINDIFRPARATAARLVLSLEDLFQEREKYLSKYCAHETLYMVLWTQLKSLTSEQLKRSRKEKRRTIKRLKLPGFAGSQNIAAAIPDLRESHDSFVRTVTNDFNDAGVITTLLGVHDALYAVRMSADPEFTDREWRPLLPGDPLPVRTTKRPIEDISDILWPALPRQVLPRDAYNINLRTAQVGDRIYATVFIDLFPKEVQPFLRLFSRTLPTHIPWRISFLVESDGLSHTGLRKVMASVLSVTSSQNRLIHDSLSLLEYIKLNTDDAVVRLRVTAVTWAPEDDYRLLRTRASMLAKAIEGWGSCNVSEFSGDAYGSVVSSMLAVSADSYATASIVPLTEVLFMMPFFRPASPWQQGAILFRSPDGKPWPYHPGSRHQTTWIDLFYARPGSGKSVLSNAMNLAVCLSPGITRLPRIAIIDIGPSSSGLVLLLKDALPADKKHLVATHRLRMRPEYAINLFDTQLGCRLPTPNERAFLVNFISLLATPVGQDKPYDGVADMAGLIVDELYKAYTDSGNPNVYASGIEEIVDALLSEIGFMIDDSTTWWEVTDALFLAGFHHEASLAQRHAVPVLSDVASICRLPAIVDLYGKIIAPTGEPLIHAFARMISSAVREYPIIAQVTRFDLGDAKIVALDLDEVARSGGDAANRQTAVMYMLARYILARHYFLVEDNINDMPEAYRRYHKMRILEIREDPKRIVFDEFHRTAKAQSVRDQVVQDMREGRKWKVQIALLSQSLDDFDPVMVEFATSIYIMDAGPEQAIRKTSATFGLTKTAENALKLRVHGPREGGATFLALYSTKYGMNTQLLTATLGPVELWALNTSADDAFLRNQLYQKIGPRAARSILAKMHPSGSIAKVLEDRFAELKHQGQLIDDGVKASALQSLVQDLIDEYHAQSG